MRLGWDEIRRRARAFSAEWADAHYEKGETQSFYNDFFAIFGVKRRTVARYEARVKTLTRAVTSMARARSPFTWTDTMPPKALIWRAATSWPGCVGRPG